VGLECAQLEKDVHNARTNVQQLTIYLPDPMTSSLDRFYVAVRTKFITASYSSYLSPGFCFCPTDNKQFARGSFAPD
jgi:hypothetical protein